MTELIDYTILAANGPHSTSHTIDFPNLAILDTKLSKLQQNADLL